MISIVKFTNFSSGEKQLTPVTVRAHMRSCDVLQPSCSVGRW